MQPTFLPWAGYFKQIASVDRFIFLDDVQLSRQSWQTRNRILVSGKEHWLSLHILHGGLDRTLAETMVEANPRWRTKLSKSIGQVYARHPYIEDLLELVRYFQELKVTSVADLNVNLIRFCMGKMTIDTVTLRSREIGSQSEAESKTRKILSLCRSAECDVYLSPSGAASYLAHDGFEEQEAIKLEFTDWAPPRYNQQGASEFVSHLSIVDVLANLGWEGVRKYVLSDWPKEYALS